MHVMDCESSQTLVSCNRIDKPIQSRDDQSAIKKLVW